MAGDPSAGEREPRLAFELGSDLGERDQVSQIAASLSRVLSMRAAAREAARLASISADRAPADGVTAQALWRSATARVPANREDSQIAELLAREAIQMLPTEMLNLGAELRVNLADVLTGHRRPGRGADGDRRGDRPLQAQGEPCSCHPRAFGGGVSRGIRHAL